MKYLMLVMLSIVLGSAAMAQAPAKNKNASDSLQVVEASCGECNFGMKGQGCNLAVKIDGKAYYVDGTNINDHGDAHAADGFCSAVRKAKVSGKLVNEKFVATSFKLLPADKEKQ